MSFDVAQFSQAGLNALAELTATKTLKLKQLFVDETERYAEDLEENPSWWATQTATTNAKVNAEIMSIGVANGQARIVVNLTLKQSQLSTVNVKTIVMSACVVNNGTEGNEITLCGIMDPNGIDVIYTASVIKISTKVSFYFKFSNASSITVANAYAPDYVLQGDLSRFVSCHKLNDADAGESQGIKGVKRFEDTTMFGQLGSGKCKMTISRDDQYHYTALSAYTQVGNNDPIAQTLTFYAYENETDFYNSITTNVSISPDHDNAQSDINLGTDDARFTEVNCDSTYTGYAYVDEEIYLRSGRHTPTICTISANDGAASVKMTTESGWSIRMTANAADITLSGSVVNVACPFIVNGAISNSGNINTSGNVVASGYIQSQGLYNLNFVTQLAHDNCAIIPQKMNIKRGNMFLGIVKNNSVNPQGLSAGDVIPATMIVYVAKFNQCLNDNLSDGLTPQIGFSRSFSHVGNNFVALNDVDTLVTGHSAMCLIMAINNFD